MESLTFRLAHGGDDEAERDFEVEFALPPHASRAADGVRSAPWSTPSWPALSQFIPCSFLSPGASFIGEQSCGDEYSHDSSEQLGWLIRVRCETVESDGTLTGLMVALPRGRSFSAEVPLVETWWQGKALQPRADAGYSSVWETTLPDGRPGPGRATDFLHWASLPGFGKEDADDFLFMRWHEQCFVKKDSDPLGALSPSGQAFAPYLTPSSFACVRNRFYRGVLLSQPESADGLRTRRLLRLGTVEPRPLPETATAARRPGNASRGAPGESETQKRRRVALFHRATGRAMILWKLFRSGIRPRAVWLSCPAAWGPAAGRSHATDAAAAR